MNEMRRLMETLDGIESGNSESRITAQDIANVHRGDKSKYLDALRSAIRVEAEEHNMSYSEFLDAESYEDIAQSMQEVDEYDDLYFTNLKLAEVK